MKNKFKKLTGLFLAAVMTLAALPIQTLASEWGVGDNVYAAMLGNYIGSDNGTYGDKRNYTFIYYKADGDVATATRVKSNHARCQQERRDTAGNLYRSWCVIQHRKLLCWQRHQ